MPTRRLPWVIKYRPKRIEDVVNQEKAKQLVIPWIRSWLEGRPRKKAALFHGPPGSGKTSMAEAIAHEYNLEIVEMNASDYRRASDIERIAKVAASQMGLFGKGKLILLDEVDGLSGLADKGAIEAILSLINITKNPIVMTANDPWSPSLRPLRDAALMVEFRRLTKTMVKRVLRRICASEGVKCEEEAIDFIAERAEGDLRSAINDLQALAEGYGVVTLEAARTILRQRDRVLPPYEVVRRIIISKYAWQAKRAANLTDLAPDELMQWIHENLPRQITHPEDLWRAYEALSRADVFFGRIRRTGAWDLLPYAIELMTAGVALAITKDLRSKYRWVRYSFPQKIQLMARTKEARAIRDEIAEAVSRHIKTSRRKVRADVLPFLTVIFQHGDPAYAAALAIGLGLGDSSIKYLAQERAPQIVKLVTAMRRELGRIEREEARKRREAKKEERPVAKPSAEEVKEAEKEGKGKRRRKGKPAGRGLDAFFKKG